MKRPLIKLCVFLVFVLIFSSCSQTKENIEEVSPSSLQEISKENINYLTTTSPEMIDADIAAAGLPNCCERCLGSIRVENLKNPEAPWALELYISCDSEPGPFFENLQFVDSWGSQSNPVGVDFDIDIIDEHNYFLFWSSPTSASVIVTQGPNVSPLPPSYTFGVGGSAFFTQFVLNCDAYTTSNCWNGGERVCCISVSE